MNHLLLSRITKDYLNLDPETVPVKERYRVGWGGSVLAPHHQAHAEKGNKREAVKQLLALRQKFANLFDSRESKPVQLSTSPKLSPPAQPAPASFSPPLYFSRGALDKKSETPIPYLLIETNETSKARPVPGNSYLFRSLCRGKGILKKNAEGLVYLDVDNRFITMMLPYLKRQGLVRPPYFNLFDAPEGAHIPVISARERAFHFLEEIDELGKEFGFEIEGFYSVEPSAWPEVEQVWFFKVRSPELEGFRRRNFLTEHPNGHDFHIAVAVKPRLGSAKYVRKHSLMRINIAFLAA